jgi:hypothetical protein
MYRFGWNNAIWQTWNHISKKLRDGIMDAYSVVFGNVENKPVLDLKTSDSVTSVSGRHGSGRVLVRAIDAVQVACCIGPSQIKGL